VAPDVPKSAIRDIVGGSRPPHRHERRALDRRAARPRVEFERHPRVPFIEEAEPTRSATRSIRSRIGSARSEQRPVQRLRGGVHPGYDDEAVTFIGRGPRGERRRGTVAGIKTAAARVATDKGVLCHPHARPGRWRSSSPRCRVPVVITTATTAPLRSGVHGANTHGRRRLADHTHRAGRIEEGLGLF